MNQWQGHPGHGQGQQPHGQQPARQGGYAPLPQPGQAPAFDWRYSPPGQVPWRAPPPPKVPLANSPFTFRHVKVSVAELPRMLREIESLLAKRRRNHILLCVLLFAISAALLVLPPLGLACGIFVAIYCFFRFRKLARKRHKFEFLKGTLDELRDELHPRAPVRFDFDLTAYDQQSKVTRTGTSATGRTKTYYSDKWLRLRLVLADRTRVEIVRQVGVKVKKGGVVYEKRRLFITATPNPRRYRPMQGEPAAGKLRWALQAAVVQGFHNPPEELNFRVTHHEADLALRVVQYDAEFLPREVTLILGGLMNHLRERCALAPG